ncbi:MAG: winged helix-turn-helix transcriptional regulator [Acidobacteria bacterium]|nr:winged helix-turn-helix transcriptional regulator [Acidobacteriota bacterium]
MDAPLHELFKAAGELTRLRILNLLRHRPICVCDLQEVLGLPQYSVSRHLAALRHAGLVRDTREGSRVVYALASAATPKGRLIHRLLVEAAPLEPVLKEDLACFRRALRRGACRVGGERKAP